MTAAKRSFIIVDENYEQVTYVDGTLKDVANELRNVAAERDYQMDAINSGGLVRVFVIAEELKVVAEQVGLDFYFPAK